MAPYGSVTGARHKACYRRCRFPCLGCRNRMPQQNREICWSLALCGCRLARRHNNQTTVLAFTVGGGGYVKRGVQGMEHTRGHRLIILAVELIDKIKQIYDFDSCQVTIAPTTNQNWWGGSGGVVVDYGEES